MTGYSPVYIRPSKKTPARIRDTKRHYLLIKNPDTSAVSLVDTTTRRGCKEFDRLYMDLGGDLIGSIDSKLSIKELLNVLGGLKNEV